MDFRNEVSVQTVVVRCPGICWEKGNGPVVGGKMVNGLRVMRPMEKRMKMVMQVGLSSSWHVVPPVRGLWPGLLKSCPGSVNGSCAWTFPSGKFPWPGSASVPLGALLPSLNPWRCGNAGRW